MYYRYRSGICDAFVDKEMTVEPQETLKNRRCNPDNYTVLGFRYQEATAASLGGRNEYNVLKGSVRAACWILHATFMPLLSIYFGR